MSVLLTAGVIAACSSPTGSPTVVTWTGATVLTPTSLKIEWAGSTCAEFADAAVDESQDTVRVTIRERSTGSDNHCNAALALRSTEVSLNRPLGKRKLLGCATGVPTPTPTPTVEPTDVVCVAS